MANNSVLKGTVNDYVKQNGAGGITGQGLQTILDTIIDALGGKYQYAGVAAPSTNPGTPDQNVFYLAATAGAYTSFGGIVLTEGEVAVLKGSGSSWTKEVTGIASAEEVSQLGQEVSQNAGFLFSIFAMTQRKGRDGGGNWVLVDNDNTHNVIRIKSGDIIEVAPVSGGNIAVGFLKTYDSKTDVSGAIDYSSATGFNSRLVVWGKTTYTAPSDANYLIVGRKVGGTDYPPSVLTINGYDLLTQITQKFNGVDTKINAVKADVNVLTPKELFTDYLSVNQYVRNAIKDIKVNGVRDTTKTYYLRISRNQVVGDTHYWQAFIYHTTFDFANVLCSAVLTSEPVLDSVTLLEMPSYGSGTTKAILCLNWGELQDGGVYLGIQLSNNVWNDNDVHDTDFINGLEDVRNNKNHLNAISSIRQIPLDIQYPTADINVVMLYGQSLAMAFEATDFLTNENVGGNVKPTTATGCAWKMLGEDFPYLNGFWGDGFVELTTGGGNGGKEPAILAAVNKLKSSMDSASFGLSADKKICAGIVGKGGLAIEQLSKGWDEGLFTIDEVDYNYYTGGLLEAFKSIKAKANANNKTVACVAIMFMQGEANSLHQWGENPDGTYPSGTPTYDKDTYKSYLLGLKNDIQGDVMTIFGQSKKPLFVASIPGQRHTVDFDVPIQRAFLEVENENDDVVLAGPNYPCPDYGSHLTSNGYRMIGEMFGKRLCQAFIKGEKYHPLRPVSVSVSGSLIIIDTNTLNALSIDDHTVKAQADLGFQVKKNSQLVTIKSIDIKETFIIINCAVELSGTIEIAYANNQSDTLDLAVKGHGNIRNQYDSMHSMYRWGTDSNVSDAGNTITYVPKDENGDSLEGSNKPYYCNDWLVPFYYSIIV